MKKIQIILVFYVYLFSNAAFSQGTDPFVGSWSGKLSFQGQSLRMVFHINIDEEGRHKAKIDSPDQGAFGLPVQQCLIDSNSITLKLPNLMASFEGVMTHQDTIVGSWKQAGLAFDLILGRGEGKTARQSRPQEPKGEKPYSTQEVIIHQPAGNFYLAGTLVIPEGKGPFPAAVLISGSGPQNRDEEIMGHKPFLVLADFLARNGIMTLRYDDRGIGSSEGDFATATTFDFTDDALVAFDFMKNHSLADANVCGMIGHSEGGMITQVAASRNNDIKFVVMMAAPGVPSDQLLLKQARLISEAQGASEREIRLTGESNKYIFSVLKNEQDQDKAREIIRTELISLSDSLTPDGSELESAMQQQLLQSVDQLFSPWFLTFIRFTPEEFLAGMKCPVLAVNGSKDRQVAAAENLDAIEKILRSSGNDQVKIVLFEGLNHLFQTAETGSPAEYATIEETMAPQVMNTISDWINNLK